MATPISVPYIVKLLYGDTGKTPSKMTLFCPSLSGVSSDSFDTITLASGASSGSTLTAAVSALITSVKPFFATTTTFSVGELYSYSSVAPHLTPLASKSFGVVGTGSGSTVPAAGTSFKMRKGRVYGSVKLLNVVSVPPQRGPAPVTGGTALIDLVFAIWNTHQYFSLKDGSWPDTAFGVSVQYYTRLQRADGTRP